MSKKEKNCRLCLKELDDDYNVIGEITREIFKVLLLKVDLSVSEKPLACKSCMESIQEAFDFKSTCVAVDEQVVSLAMERDAVELDITDVYLNKNENKVSVFNEDCNICRFCLQCQEKSNFNPLNDLRKHSYDEMLLKCLPELDLNLIKESVVCTTCIQSLNSYHSFAIICQNTEVNIKKFCEVQGVTYNGHISLSNVLKFVFEGMLEYIGNCDKAITLQGEDNFSQNEENSYSDINKTVLKVEKEEHIIKNENNYCETKLEELVKCDDLTYKDSLETHNMLSGKNSANVTIYKCNLCKYKTKQKSNLRMHLLTHKDSSEVKNYLKTHMLTHDDSSDGIMYRCDRCTFETKYKESMQRHMLIHKDNSEVTMYKCNFCSYETKWKNYLKNHMLTHDDSSDRVMYRCDRCTYETKYKSALKSHMLIHKDNSEVTMYMCNLCNYESKRKGNLRSHMLLHKDSSDVVMYRCAECTYETKYKASLKAHMLTHKSKAEMITYKCNLCSYEGKRKDYLESHMLIHKDSSEVEIYRCQWCTFKTKHRESLVRHLLSHRDNSEVTMYKCNLCSYETKWKNYLTNHLITHKDSSEIVMFRCEMCNFKTKLRCYLRKHMVLHKNRS